MLEKALSAALGGMLLAGCAGSSAVMQPLSSSHPANPDAAESPLPPPSKTLEIETAGIGEGTSTTQNSMPEMEHNAPDTNSDHQMHEQGNEQGNQNQGTQNHGGHQ